MNFLIIWDEEGNKPCYAEFEAKTHQEALEKWFDHYKYETRDDRCNPRVLLITGNQLVYMESEHLILIQKSRASL